MAKLISAAKIAVLYGVHQQTIRKWATDGTIPSVQHGQQIRFDAEAVADALEGHSTVAARNAGEGLRRCSKCGQAKPVGAFPIVKCSRTGKRKPCSHCKECRRTMKRVRAGLMRNTQVEPIDRTAVAERDGWTCSICRGVVTRDDWSLDHIKPLSRGGTHTHDNVAIAHFGCNAKKRDGARAQ